VYYTHVSKGSKHAHHTSHGTTTVTAYCERREKESSDHDLCGKSVGCKILGNVERGARCQWGLAS